MRPLWPLALILLLHGNSALGQDESMLAGLWPDPGDKRAGEHEFVLMRGIYANYQTGASSGYRGGPRNRAWWQTDFDGADRNLLRGLRRYTSIDTSSDSFKVLSLTDPELFEHPFLYINMKRVPLYSGNGPNFSVEEAAALQRIHAAGRIRHVGRFLGA